MHILADKCQLTLHSLSKIQLIVNNPSKSGMSSSASHAANQRSNSSSDTRAAKFTRITTPTSRAPSSNASTPHTLSPQIPTFDHIVNKLFSKSLIASLTGKDALLKEVLDCILTNNEN